MISIPALEANGIVYDYDDICQRISAKQSIYFTIYDLENLIDSKGMKAYYYADTAKSVDECTFFEEEDSVAKILELALIDKESGTPLALSFLKKAGRDNNLVWQGCFLDTREKLFRRIFRIKTVNKNIAKVKIEETVSYKNIYDQLFYKENWENNGSYDRLGSYLQAIVSKIENCIKSGNTSYASINESKTALVYNSRLLDKYGNYIHMLTHKSSWGDWGVGSLVNSIYDLGSGWNIKTLDVEPVDFFENEKSTIFKGDINEFDLTDVKTLDHICRDRINRFPESYRTASPIELANLIRSSVTLGVKMSKIDDRFVVPMYNKALDIIQWLMPLYFSFGEGVIPKLAMVLSKRNGMWIIRTILPMEEAYADARAISNPSVGWLRIDLDEDNSEVE